MNRVNIPIVVRPLLQEIGRIADQRGMPAYAVGGCVRDWLSGIPHAEDLDIAVEGRGIEVARAVADALRERVIIHEQFGTATVITQSTVHPSTSLGTGSPQSTVHRVDFAMCRRETYAKPAAYPKVTAGTLEEDLFRRDFTINAMAVAIAPERFGALRDPFGGASDLRRRALRILHQRSFLDDPSRILRGIRFAERCRLRWDAETERAARHAVAAGALGWLNAGRLRKELDRMTQEPEPGSCFNALAALLETVAQGSGFPGPPRPQAPYRTGTGQAGAGRARGRRPEPPAQSPERP